MTATPLFEIVEKRTENAKHWRMSDGSYQANITLGPQHYADDSGTWQNIDTSIVDPVAVAIPKQPIGKTLHANGGWAHSNHFTTPYNKADLRLPKNIKSGYAIGFGPDRLTFTPVGASPSLGQINPVTGNEIDYQDVWVDTDLSLMCLEQQIKETITLKSNNSPTTFSFRVDGPLASDFTSGSLNVLAPWYKDANGTQKDATMTQRTQGSQTFVDITLDLTGMSFPVTLDPTVSLQDTQDAYTSTKYPSGNYSTQAIYYAGYDYTVPNSWSSYLQFDVSSIPANSTISAANVTLSIYSFATSTSKYAIDPVTASWVASSITYNTRPATDTTKRITWTVTFPTTQYATTSFDVTSFVTGWLNTTLPNDGFVIWDPWNANESWCEFSSSKDTTTSHRPYLSVTYNQPPTAPTVTAPNGGETINTTYNITWTAATDPDTAQSALTYQIDLSQDNGTTWSTIVSQTAAGATSYNYDFTNTPASSTNLIRIRAYDGTSYGPYDQSNGVFTIQHDKAPTAPTNLSPANNTPLDRTQAITGTWQFNDPDAGDAQSKFDIKWSTDSGTTWTEIDGTASASSSYQWAANTFADGATVQWMVRTYDQSGLDSPWSAQAQFTTHNPTPTPTITSPANGASVATANPLVQWSASGQAGYELQVRDTNGTSLYDEQHTTSTNNAQTLTGYNLANGTSYELALRILGTSGLWSPWTVNTVNVSYTPPAQATATATADNANARITVTAANPAPSGSQPAVDHIDLYRRNSGSTGWTRIATGLAANSTYQDYAVASGQAYDYKFTSIGSNQTSTDSTIAASVSVGQLRGLWVHDVSNPSGTVLNLEHMMNTNGDGTTPNGVALKHQATELQFAGRDLPNVEFGESYAFTLTKGRIAMFDADGKWPSLEVLIRVNKPTFCFRDGRGRMIFGAVADYKAVDLTGGTMVDLVLRQTSYSMTV